MRFVCYDNDSPGAGARLASAWCASVALSSVRIDSTRFGMTKQEVSLLSIESPRSFSDGSPDRCSAASEIAWCDEFVNANASSSCQSKRSHHGRSSIGSVTGNVSLVGNNVQRLAPLVAKKQE